MKRISQLALLSGIVGGGLFFAGGAGTDALAKPSGVSSRSSFMGPTMMGSFRSNGMMGGRQQSSTRSHALTVDQAQRRVQLYIREFANPHLVIDEIVEFQRNFYAVVKDTSTGHGAFEVLINRWSGMVFPEYGPAMMWNTRYGMMGGHTAGGGMMGNGNGAAPMTISSSRAAHIAGQWLAQYRPNLTMETPDHFPGYYTVHLHKNGVMAGMLSVNGYSGRVWYHNWHGTFIRIRTVHG